MFFWACAPTTCGLAKACKILTADTHLGGAISLGTESVRGRETGISDWVKEYEQATALVTQMTINERIAIVSGQNETKNGCSGMIPGVSCVGSPGICLSSGPNGLHGVAAVNGYASAITVDAAWNKELALARGHHIGPEAKHLGGENTPFVDEYFPTHHMTDTPAKWTAFWDQP